MKKILVIGDSCKDVFVYCKAERLAPDLPVPVLSITRQKENPGMAANVERNIHSLYPHVALCTNDSWKKVTKTRYVHGPTNHVFVRVDTSEPIKRVDVKKIPLQKYDIIAISDYNKGFLTEDDIRYICAHHDTVFMDTKKILGSWASKAAYIKINNLEYELSKPHMPKSLDKKIIYTKGDYGAFFQGKNYPVQKVEVRDLTGAGDTFFAGLIVKYAETGDIEEGIRFANECASEAVKHKGVTVIRR